MAMGQGQGQGQGDTREATGPRPAPETGEKLLALVGAFSRELRPSLEAEATLDSAFDRDLGLDSLARIELIGRLEQAFDVTLPERVFVSAETPRDLLRAVLSTGHRETTGAVSTEFAAGAVSGEAIAAPREAGTLNEVLNWHVDAHPDRVHIRLYDDENDGEGITYGELLTGAQRIATGLRERDFRPGDAVALMLPTGRDYFMSFFGVLLAGGTAVPIYPPASPSQIEEHLKRHTAILANSLARTLISVPEAKQFTGLMLLKTETLRHVVTVEELGRSRGDYPEVATGPGDIAFLQYTSGSTGAPKGVVLSHANLLANIRAMGEVMKVTPDDVFVSWLPLYHDMGLIGAWLGSLTFAVPLVIMSPLAFLSRPERWLWAIHRHRGTLSAAPNFAYELCLRRIPDQAIEGLDLGSWRAAFNGAEGVSPVTIERFTKRFQAYGFDPRAVMPVYGLAENSVGVTFPPLGRGAVTDRIKREAFMRSGQAEVADETAPNPLAFVSCGRPLPDHEIRVVDDTGAELPERRRGRLQFRGPSATSGYFRNAEATRRLFSGDWLETGDFAYMADGEVHITGRMKDVIIRAGRNIYPEELEEAVGGLEGVQKGNVAVFGSPDPDTGTERLIVLAETRKSDPETRRALKAEIVKLATELTGMPPDDVVLAPPRSVPKTTSGKIRRAASRELYEKDLIGRPGTAVWVQVVRIVIAAAVPKLKRVAATAAAGVYGAYALVLGGLLVPVLWLIAALAPGRSAWAPARLLLRLLAFLTTTPLTIRGRENLPPEGSPCIYVVNHMSYLDGFVLNVALARPLTIVVKAELIRHWITRIPLTRLGCQFVERFDREKGLEDARRVAAGIAQGQTPVYFAEGTFVRAAGLLPFQLGAFMAAVEAGVPIVPIAIRGTRSILRSQEWLPRRGAITVTIGRPLTPPVERPGGLFQAALALRDAARAHILTHCGEPDLAHERSPVLRETARRAAMEKKDG